MTGAITPSNIVQFRAIPYGTIPARFKHSVLNTTPFDAENGDFTKHGFACPQVFPSDIFNGGPFPGESLNPKSDEFKCLILQLSVPLAHLRCLSANPGGTPTLPVFTYIHGGGFVLGKIAEQNSTGPIVEQSVVDGQPIIAASLQYRLGALGFVYTGEPGEVNVALGDQRNALLWIQRFVGGFGGDAERHTVWGESAGAISIYYHMLCAPPPSGPLFTKAVCMSGVIGPMTAPADVQAAKQQYDTLLAKVGIKERGKEGLEKLRKLSVEEIIRASAEMSDRGSLWVFVQDEDWFGAEEVTWDRVPERVGRCEWVDSIVLGTTGFEGTTFTKRMKHVTPKAFLDGITEQLGEESVRILTQAYEMAPDMDQSLFLDKGLRWVGDVLFDAPTHDLAIHLTTHKSKKVYRYIFNAGSPFPISPFHLHPHHWVDIYFVFKTFQFRFPSRKLKDISTRHAQLWISFANGQAPWANYVYSGKGDETVMMADERDGWTETYLNDAERMLGWSWRRCEGLIESWRTMKGKIFLPMAIGPLNGGKVV